MAKLKNEIIQKSLENLFVNHRLVFWYDEGGAMADIYDAFQLDGVNKIEITKNPFTVKYQLTIVHPNEKFLVYSREPRLDNDEDWLLSLELSQTVFKADSDSIYARECNVPAELKTQIVTRHSAFFDTERNRNALKSRLDGSQSENQIVRQMIVIALNCRDSFNDVMMTIFDDEQDGNNKSFDLLKKYNLDKDLWKIIEQRFNFKMEDATVIDLLTYLFKTDMLSHFTNESLTADAQLLMNSWRDSKDHSELYKTWAKKLESVVNVDAIIRQHHLKPEQLLRVYTFPHIIRYVAAEMQRRIIDNSISASEIDDWNHQLQNSIFYPEGEHFLQAMYHASEMIALVRQGDGFEVYSLEKTFERYYKEYYRIDQEYRLFLQEKAKCPASSGMKQIEERVLNTYTNSYLFELGGNWQQVVDKMTDWKIPGIIPQQNFYNVYISKYATDVKNPHVVVIISDGMRYESMKDLERHVNAENMMEAKIQKPMLASLPSYTQIGMASLLPHKELSFSDDGKTIFADGMSTAGTENRKKVLQARWSRSLAIQADDFLRETSKYWKEELKNFNIIYVYSDIIDQEGHQNNLDKATEKEIDHVVKIIRQAANANISNIIVTSDHGYIYQDEDPEHTDYTSYSPIGSVLLKDRRFIIGRNLAEDNSVHTWNAQQLNYGGDINIQTLKSINRMRLSGASIHYVHGGTMPQEVAVPVLIITKKRQSDVQKVDIDVIAEKWKITAQGVRVKFYQESPISDKVQEREMRIGFFDADDNLLSDEITLQFNSDKSESVQREQTHRFRFSSDISNHNGEKVYLKLREQEGKSSQYKEYKSFTYEVDVMFSPEFF